MLAVHTIPTFILSLTMAPMTQQAVQSGQDVQVAISTIATPESGTYTLTDGTDTTAAIEFGASGLDVQTALNALNTDTGPFADLVDVVKQSRHAIFNHFPHARRSDCHQRQHSQLVPRVNANGKHCRGWRRHNIRSTGHRDRTPASHLPADVVNHHQRLQW